MSVYLYRIYDRPFGFRVVAIVADSDEDAFAELDKRFRVTAEPYGRDRSRSHACLEGICRVAPLAFTDMEYEE